jgi:putative ABC transport system permease protein
MSGSRSRASRRSRNGSTACWRRGASTLWLVSLFSFIALGLAVVGIYGVLMESVAQRVPEIGVRMALGASAAGVMRLFLRQGGWMIAIGVMLGAGAAFALSGVMASFVFGVPPTDPVSFAVACLAVTMAGLLACAIRR